MKVKYGHYGPQVMKFEPTTVIRLIFGGPFLGGPFPAAKPREKTRAGHYKNLTETGNRARKVSGTQGSLTIVKIGDTTNVLYKPRFHADRSRDLKTQAAFSIIISPFLSYFLLSLYMNHVSGKIVTEKLQRTLGNVTWPDCTQPSQQETM